MTNDCAPHCEKPANAPLNFRNGPPTILFGGPRHRRRSADLYHLLRQLHPAQYATGEAGPEISTWRDC